MNEAWVWLRNEAALGKITLVGRFLGQACKSPEVHDNICPKALNTYTHWCRPYYPGREKTDCLVAPVYGAFSRANGVYWAKDLDEARGRFVDVKVKVSGLEKLFAAPSPKQADLEREFSPKDSSEAAQPKPIFFREEAKKVLIERIKKGVVVKKLNAETQFIQDTLKERWLNHENPKLKGKCPGLSTIEKAISKMHSDIPEDQKI